MIIGGYYIDYKNRFTRIMEVNFNTCIVMQRIGSDIPWHSNHLNMNKLELSNAGKINDNNYIKDNLIKIAFELGVLRGDEKISYNPESDSLYFKDNLSYEIYNNGKFGDFYNNESEYSESSNFLNIKHHLESILENKNKIENQSEEIKNAIDKVEEAYFWFNKEYLK